MRLDLIVSAIGRVQPWGAIHDKRGPHFGRLWFAHHDKSHLLVFFTYAVLSLIVCHIRLPKFPSTLRPEVQQKQGFGLDICSVESVM